MLNTDSIILRHYRDKAEYFDQAYEDHENNHSEHCDEKHMGNCLLLIDLANKAGEAWEAVAEINQILEDEKAVVADELRTIGIEEIVEAMKNGGK